MARRYFVIVTEDLDEDGVKAEVHPVAESQAMSIIRPDTKTGTDIWSQKKQQLGNKIGRRMTKLLTEGDPEHKQLEGD